MSRQGTEKRLITLPLIEEHSNPGKPDDSVTYRPDFLGQDGVVDFRIRTNYRDVGKVEVKAPLAVLDALHAMSRAHFAELWKQPEDEF